MTFWYNMVKQVASIPDQDWAQRILWQRLT